MSRTIDFSILSKSPSFGSYSWKHHHWTSLGSSCCEIIDGYGIEVTTPSIANPTQTSDVVISREAERFVNEIHCHEEELRSSNELLTELQGSEKSEPVKKAKEARATRKLVPTLSAIRLKEHLCTYKEPFLQMRGNGRSFMQLHQMEDIWQLLY